MRYIILFFVIITNLSCAQDKLPLLGDTDYQRQMNADFKDAAKSPLTDRDRKVFRSLDFFKFDSTYVVNADFKRTPNETPFKMKTTTDREVDYIKYGEATFTIKDKLLKLNVYQDLEMAEEVGQEEALFLPFMDNTNGVESYKGGRYIEVKLPKDDKLLIDFNKAYNPYCAYNKKYSCPIVPSENILYVRIEAGVKKYIKA
ncbi:DUF1684 domain-containing protein [Olleya marilimosa]|uniref:DUF1684 domain-containing protein n=1 Tax=Olleya marilimosa TaxID=272164 RepID=A0ABR8LUS4_9FLAO|nr:DUF1684 domain-containing protein [Olleya marilimosa]MBD3863441.1 DUF1684 domain-containing protein [Olleya marilimosa]MBD3891198.1 DUF1684 domain-containing protein [Olleya marilimosa]